MTVEWELENGWIGRIQNSPVAPVKVVVLTPQERAQMFADVANNTIKSVGHIFIPMEGNVYYKIDRSEDGRAMYFHYWVMIQDTVVKIGSGGYIPFLHVDPEECVYEFELKQFGGVKALKDA